jgi:hypothetical protein
MAKSVLSTMGKAAVQCLKNPGRPSFWVEDEGRYICPDENEVGRIEHTTALSAGRLDPRFKLVFLTAASGTLLFTLICVAINLTTNGDLPPARKELTESILTMAKIGFGAIVGLLGGKCSEDCPLSALLRSDSGHWVIFKSPLPAHHPRPR